MDLSSWFTVAEIPIGMAEIQDEFSHFSEYLAMFGHCRGATGDDLFGWSHLTLLADLRFAL
ncbi:MAG: hypothetical protein CML13_08205 [Puniceicoccaceae bacterium]|nr:hypothetical protein [Puniceicoccaceae bacterium]|tara:strand:- start:668 stop:850 length:183 start_codon:yes stop_codon:yes gene_type:complete